MGIAIFKNHKTFYLTSTTTITTKTVICNSMEISTARTYPNITLIHWFFFLIFRCCFYDIFRCFVGVGKKPHKQRMESTAQCNMVFSGKYICEHNLRWILTDYHTYANFKVRTIFFFVSLQKEKTTYAHQKNKQTEEIEREKNKANLTDKSEKAKTEGKKSVEEKQNTNSSSGKTKQTE